MNPAWRDVIGNASARIRAADPRVRTPRSLRAGAMLASCYRAMGRIGEAIELGERTLADYERILGLDHPDALRAGGILLILSYWEVGVELDPTTAAIAAALYLDATIRTESFADTPSRGGHSLHNHCIIESLALTRPGGIVAVLTSRYTLDAQNPAARREINAMADLVGAVRLPTGAHQRAAGAVGAWWLDPIVGLLIAGVAAREGLEAWSGECCACTSDPLAALREEDCEDSCSSSNKA